RLVLNNCNLELGACCTSFTTGAAYKDLVYVGNGNYTFTSTLTTNMTGVTRVTANILSTSLAYSAASCGTNGPVNSYVTGAQPMAGFTPTLPVPNGDEVIWSNSSGANLSSGVNFSFNIKFPYPPPATGNCVDYLSFCIKYSFTDGNCRTCEVIRCFGPIQRGGPSPVNNNNVIRDPN
ncbi:MAG TPA: hypothetical protein VJT09_04020, partial [Pyrinomonadaceae bacterium]|nr:hypothetical protein [Pyrinomonadaceae bacterium]